MIVMTEKESRRYEIIKELIDGVLDGTEASRQIGLSVRQTKRLKVGVIKKGVAGVIHKNRGKPSNRKIDGKIIEKATKLLKEKYPDFKPTFASEKLFELHNIKISKETTRQIMAKEKLWKIKARRQPKNKHLWRPRKDNYGQMQQFDGSYHLWLEDRNEEMCLLASIDDATGRITKAVFAKNEGVESVSTFWKEYIEEMGIPVMVYLDKYSTYKINHKNAVDNKDLMTQFGRMMRQVGCELVSAHSPEAKGRVERLFGTLQDRLVKEMRLAGIKTQDEANEFLKKYIPKFNEKFAVVPNKKADLHKKASNRMKEKMPQIFSVQNARKINNDYTVMFKTKYYQLDSTQDIVVYKKDAVIVEEHLTGEVKIRMKDIYLKYSILPERPKKQCSVDLIAITQKIPSSWKPPRNHPWRNSLIFAK
ncbi:Mobile element protein, partial [hydrothermal vent metagenome]